MDTTALLPLLLGLLVGLALGFVLALVLHRSRQQVVAAEQRADDGSVQVELERARGEADRARGEAAAARGDTDRTRAAVAEAERGAALAHGELQTARAETARIQALLSGAEAARDAAWARAEEVTADREALADRFKTLSTEVLERQGRQADATAEQRYKATEQLFAPLNERLADMTRRLTEVEKERAGLHAELRTQVATVRTTGEDLRRETHALTTALRKPHVRGAWGEMALKRTAEVAGMVEHCDFTTQHTATVDERGVRPDMRVDLSDGKCVFVDSKVPLASFLDAQESQDPQQRQQLLTQFGKNVRTHVDQLSGKGYWLADEGTPELVVLFLGSESLAAEAFAVAPDLHAYAAERNVMIATPTVLITLLRSVSHGWRQAALAENAAEVLKLGRDLYERLSTMGGHFDKMGRQLGQAVNAYNDTIGALERRVLVSGRKLRDLKVSDKQLKSPDPLDQLVRPLTHPELVADAAAVEPMIGRSRRARTHSTGHEQDTIFDRDPALEELVTDELAGEREQPGERTQRRRHSS